MSGDREADGDGEELAFAQADPGEEFPILVAFTSDDAEADVGAEEGPELDGGEWAAYEGGAVFAEEGLQAGVVVLGGVEVFKELAVAFDEVLDVHARDDVGGAVHVVAGGFTEEAAFAFHAGVEGGAGRGLEDADHGHDDAAFLDEIDLPLEDARGVGVEADDEAALNLEAVLLDGFDAGYEVAATVLDFVALGEAFLGGGFEADEDGVEAGLVQHVHEGGIVGEVDGGFGVEGEAFFAAPPGDEGGEQFFEEVAFVADEVVIDEEDGVAPAALVEGIEFGDDLGGGFGAGLVPEEGGDVAEVAVEGAASRILDAHRGVAAQAYEIPAGDGGFGEGGVGGGSVAGFGPAGGEVVEEGLEGVLGFVEHEVIDMGEGLGLAGEERAAADGALAHGLGTADDFEGGGLLHAHAAEHDDVGPGQLLVGQMADVEIDEPDIPGLGQHGGHREQAERREGGLFADKAEGVLEAPKGGRELRIDEQDVHGFSQGLPLELKRARIASAEHGQRDLVFRFMGGIRAHVGRP